MLGAPQRRQRAFTSTAVRDLHPVSSSGFSPVTGRRRLQPLELVTAFRSFEFQVLRACHRVQGDPSDRRLCRQFPPRSTSARAAPKSAPHRSCRVRPRRPDQRSRPNCYLQFVTTFPHINILHTLILRLCYRCRTRRLPPLKLRLPLRPPEEGAQSQR